MQPSLWPTIRDWWTERRRREGFRRSCAQFLANLWQYLRDSAPARRRQLYGDVDYDWEHRVNTTSATVGWRDRLMGLFLSPYQATEPALFHEMLGTVNLDLAGFTFIDLGSGKGRTLLMASDYPFRRIIGVEVLPALHRIAEQNIRDYKSESQKCFDVVSICADARSFTFPREPILLYLFNPLPEAGLAQTIHNLEDSLRRHPRPVYVIYHNPLLEHLLIGSSLLTKTASTHQYSIFAARIPAGDGFPNTS